MYAQESIEEIEENSGYSLEFDDEEALREGSNDGIQRQEMPAAEFELGSTEGTQPRDRSDDDDDAFPTSRAPHSSQRPR